MIRVACLIPGAVYAPELYALRDYFAENDEVSFTLVGTDEDPPDAKRFDLLYRLMGRSPRWEKSTVPEIHDYASLSVGRLPRCKNFVKRISNRTPVLFSFLSERVRSEYRFSSDIPYIIRDMGVPSAFLVSSATEKSTARFDFLYAGMLTTSRQIDRMAHAVSRAGRSILMVGEPEDRLYREIRGLPGVHFAGRVDRTDIPDHALQCRFGLNFTPDIYPYNLQTSTKVLEYCALGLGVVSNRYSWVEEFASASGARFLFYDGLESLDFRSLDDFAFSLPDMREYAWDSVLERSGVEEAIRAAVCG